MLHFVCFTLFLSADLASSKYTHDSAGREFMIAFMENWGTEFPLKLFILPSSRGLTNVNVSILSNSQLMNTEQFSVTEGSYKYITVEKSLRLSGNELSQKGISIESDNDVIVYGANNERYSTDVFLALPVDVLGTEYFAVTYFPATRKCQISIVGVYNETTVNITFPSNNNFTSVIFNGITYNQSDVITLTMNKRDALQIQSDGDLTGTFISSDKHIVAYSGNLKTKTGNAGSSQDHLVVQLTPIDTWGKTFVTMPSPERATGDIFRIVSSRPGTTVNYTCSNNGSPVTKSFSLQDAGDFNQMIITSSDFCSFVADLPIMIVQILVSMNGSADPGDPSFILIPSTVQYTAEHMYVTPHYDDSNEFKNFFMFAIEKTQIDGLRFDGNKIPDNTQCTDIPNTGLVGGYISVSHGYHTVSHVSSFVTFEGIAYGKTNHESYAMATGRKMERINMICQQSQQNPGDGKDNDCDGLFDEENCDDAKTGDDDGDGLDNEDCAPAAKILSVQRKQWRILPSNVPIPRGFAVIDVTSVENWSCGMLCYKEPSCVTYSYDQTNKRCTGYSKNYINYDINKNTLLDRSNIQLSGDVQYFISPSHLEINEFILQVDLSLCYKLHTSKKNRTEAEETCAQEDSRLVIINSATNLDVLQKLFTVKTVLASEPSVFVAGHYYKGRWEFWNNEMIPDELWETNGRNEIQGQCVSMTSYGLKSANCQEELYFVCGK